MTLYAQLILYFRETFTITLDLLVKLISEMRLYCKNQVLAYMIIVV